VKLPMLMVRGRAKLSVLMVWCRAKLPVLTVWCRAKLPALRRRRGARSGPVDSARARSVEAQA
jgi:hypothetical protein